MNDILRMFIEFLIVFIAIYLFYYFISYRKLRKSKKYMSVETKLIVLWKGINVKKINYNSFLKIIGITNAFNIALSIIIVMRITKSMYLQMLLGLVFLLLLSFFSYNFIGNYYKGNKE